MSLFPIGIAALLAILVALRSPEHWPVAFALNAFFIADFLLGQHIGGPWLDLALYLAAPALSAWCAILVLTEHSGAAAGVEAWLILALVASTSSDGWEAAPLIGHLASVAVQGMSAWAWGRSDLRASGSSLCVLAMFAGDVMALLGPLGLGGPWWIVAWQTALLGVVLCVIQLAALAAPWARSRWPVALRDDAAERLALRLRERRRVARDVERDRGPRRRG
jgi:hypothetical protein